MRQVVENYIKSNWQFIKTNCHKAASHYRVDKNSIHGYVLERLINKSHLFNNINGDDGFRRWVFTIIKRACINEKESGWSKFNYPLGLINIDENLRGLTSRLPIIYYPEYESKELEKKIIAYIKTRFKSADIFMMLMKGYSYKEIAEITKTETEINMQRVAYIRLNLKKILF